MKIKHSFIIFIYLFSLTALWAAEDPGTYFKTSDGGSSYQVDHTGFQKILDAYLDDQHPSGINRFDYGRVTSGDKLALKSYVKKLSEIKVTTLGKNEQMAYWINMYNALTIDVILDHYPVKSIRSIRSGIFKPGPWDLKLVSVEGIALSLNDIEHVILRPIWRDKRIHYTVNCASLGCPNLRKLVYTAETLEVVLDEAAREYINHKRGAHIENGTLVLSSIYKWYAEDFGTKNDLLNHIASFSEDKKVKAQLSSWDGSIKYQYDWNLNAP